MALTKINEALLKLPEILLRSRFSFTFDDTPLIAERLSIRKKLNLIRCGVDKILHSNVAHSMPPSLQIESTNICNLQCPLCPTGTGLSKRNKGFMSFETLRTILDELEDTLIVAYFIGWGEPFLNKETTRMIEACTARNICTLASTNGHSILTLDDALRVVDAGLSALIIALDGSTQKVYEVYRKGGDIEKVKRCTALIEQAKAKRRVNLPYTNLRTVVTRNNQGDLLNIEKLARELGVNMFSYKSLGCVTFTDKFKDYEPTDKDMRRFEYDGTIRQRRLPIWCSYPFRQPILFWDGTVVGCEFDYDLEIPFGKVGKQGFKKIWNSRNALKLRRSINTKKGYPEFCNRCPFQDSIQNSCVISYIEYRPLDGVNTKQKIDAM